MGRPRRVRPDWAALATIWEVSDELWLQLAPVLAEIDPPKRTGRPRVDARATLNAIVVTRPQPTAEQPQHLCLDKGYDNPTGEDAVAAHGYVPHIRRIGEEKLDPATGEQRFPARRWVVERTLAWLSKCRALLVRYDKRSANFLALLKLACALLWFRRLHRLSLLR